MSSQLHERNTDIYEFFIQNPEYTLENIGQKFGLKRSQVCNVINLYKPSEIEVQVVASLHKENTYFIFNGVNEKMFETDCYKKIKKDYHFDTVEKYELIKLGFRL
jgi:hypothetical protein